MISASLHAPSRLGIETRNGPNPCGNVDLIPSRADCFARSAGCQNCELHASRGNRRGFPQPTDESWNIVDRHGRVPPHRFLAGQQEVIEIAPPSGRVLALAQVARLGGVQHLLDPAAHALCGLVLRLPDRLEHGQHVVGADFIDWYRPQRCSMCAQRGPPLLTMFGVDPAVFQRVDYFVGELTERWHSRSGISLCVRRVGRGHRSAVRERAFARSLALARDTRLALPSPISRSFLVRRSRYTKTQRRRPSLPMTDTARHRHRGAPSG